MNISNQPGQMRYRNEYDMHLSLFFFCSKQKLFYEIFYIFAIKLIRLSLK